MTSTFRESARGTTRLNVSFWLPHLRAKVSIILRGVFIFFILFVSRAGRGTSLFFVFVVIVLVLIVLVLTSESRPEGLERAKAVSHLPGKLLVGLRSVG